MDLIILILGIAVIGFVVWLITEKIPMDQPFKIIIYVIVAIILIYWVGRHFGGLIPKVLP